MTLRESGVMIIEGNIGIGKTTLAHKITEKIIEKGLKATTHEEPASGTNPFLDDYYRDPRGTAFKMQMFMLASRYKTTLAAQASAHDGGGWHVLDRSYYGDICFANVQRKNGYFTEAEFQVYLSHHRMMRTHIEIPAFAVFLRGDVKMCQRRIAKRARSCESGIADSYLKALQVEIDALEAVMNRRCRIMRIDENADLTDAEIDKMAQAIVADATNLESENDFFDYRGDWRV